MSFRLGSASWGVQVEAAVDGQVVYGPQTWACVPGPTNVSMTDVRISPGSAVQAAEPVTVTVYPQVSCMQHAMWAMASACARSACYTLCPAMSWRCS